MGSWVGPSRWRVGAGDGRGPRRGTGLRGLCVPLASGSPKCKLGITLRQVELTIERLRPPDMPVRRGMPSVGLRPTAPRATWVRYARNAILSQRPIGRNLSATHTSHPPMTTPDLTWIANDIRGIASLDAIGVVDQKAGLREAAGQALLQHLEVHPEGPPRPGRPAAPANGTDSRSVTR